MKKLVTIVLLIALSMPLMAIVHSYAEESVLNSGHWVKIRVSESGVCRMSFDELRAAGIEPTQVRVFGYGGAMLSQNFQNAKIDDLPQVPVYVGTDYILFYVQGPISWNYDTAKGRFVHTRNTYSDYGYYFLSDDAGNMLAPTTGDTITGTPTDITSYPAYMVHDKDSINLIDRSGLSGGGRTFYGEQFSPGKSRSFGFTVPDALTESNSTVFIDLAAYASSTSTFTATLNGTTMKSVSIDGSSDNYTFGVAKTISISGPADVNQSIQLSFQNSSASALGWLNYIEITTIRALQMYGSYMPIRTLTNRNSNTPVRFHLTNANENIQVWDITDLSAITRMPTVLEGDELQWTGTQNNGVHEYIAVNTTGTKFVSAEVVGNVANQNLHTLNNINYVIICPEGFEAQATRLAQAHQNKEAITWAVVTDKQVYNEFSSGTPDATAYRWLMKMLYDRANNGIGEKPRWLLLMGHGTFDNRKLLINSGSNLLLTYQSKNSLNEVSAYATDDYFGFLDNNEGETDEAGRMDIGVGRLTVESVAEATTTVDKLVAYIENGQRGKWKNQILYLADDGEHGKHTGTAEESAEKIRIKNPDFIVHKVYLDAYPQEVNASGESYPLAKNKVLNLLKNGVLFFDYSGHGGYNAITNESILNLKDIESMSNKNHAFWIFCTCNFAQFDGGRRCAAESAVLNPKGAAIGILSATRTVYADQNTKLNRAVCDTLFGHRNAFHYEMTLGEAVAIGKNKLGTQTNKLAYVLLGDPAMRLNYPTDYQVETTTQVDTLNALSVQHIEGRIIDEDSLTVTDFNGKVDITVYDKMQVITTRDNDEKGDDAVLLSYNDYPNTLFSGATEVTNGLFNYTFMIPKDIRYNYGNGRIVYYAVTADSLEDVAEAVGHFEKFVIGGTGSIFNADTVGPEMEIYLNTPAFQNGDKTYPTPRFFAELEDPHGINTAGAGIGHDLMLIIDDDPSKIYSLNEYFKANDNSYQSGLVSYLMEALPEGPHSLSFRAWDLLNNSTSKTLNFIVEAGLNPSIYNVMTYPNPVQQTSVLNLIVNYDQPDEALTTEVYLYNTAGQMIYNHKQDNPDQVAINLAELDLMPGVYMYNVKIKAVNSRYSAASGKIIVTK